MVMTKSSDNVKQCYLCGEKLIRGNKQGSNFSRDHVPPDCMFPSEKPPNLVTIPCCKPCNRSFKVLDEKMRNYFAVLASDKSGEVGNVARKEILRSQRLSEDFISHTKKHPSLVDESGRPRLLFYFNDEELQRWLIRVVKGIFFHRNKYRISDRATYSVRKYPELTPQSSNTFPMEKGLEFRPHFVYGIVKEKNTDFWVLIFYDRLMFSVSVDSSAG
jgi:hypothetical protein